jgi:hypothetical protein
MKPGESVAAHVGALMLCSALVAVPCGARGEGASVPGPEGAPVTRENYPTELADRPLVHPPGMLNASIGVSGVSLTSVQQPSLGTSVSYAFLPGFELGVQGEILASPDVELYASWLLMRNAAVHIWGEYNFANGTNENESEAAFGLGIPLKFKLPKVPIAIGGLDNLFEANFQHWPSRTVTIQTVPFGNTVTLSAADGIETLLRVPVWLEVSPLRVLSFEAGAEAGLLLSNNIQPTMDATVVVNSHYLGYVRVFGEVIFTVRHLDVGAEVAGIFSLYDNAPAIQRWYGNFFIDVRF